MRHRFEVEIELREKARRVDLAGTAARLVPMGGRQTAWAAGQLLNLALGVGLAAAAGIIVVNVS